MLKCIKVCLLCSLQTSLSCGLVHRGKIHCSGKEHDLSILTLPVADDILGGISENMKQRVKRAFFRVVSPKHVSLLKILEQNGRRQY